MPQTVTLNVDTPISSVSMVDKATGHVPPPVQEQADVHAVSTGEAEKTLSLCKSLEKAVADLRQFQEELFNSHREQIAQLSVKIAEKILLKEIDSGQYDIKQIISQALKTAPGHNDIVVRVNPDDLKQLSEVNSENEELSNVKLTSDPNIGPAHCIVETDKGIVEHCIEEYLNQVAQALKGSD